MPTLHCPICQTQVAYTALTEVPYRPFCCERCKAIDLGRWLTGEYRISEDASEVPMSEKDSDGEPPPAD